MSLILRQVFPHAPYIFFFPRPPCPQTTGRTGQRRPCPVPDGTRSASGASAQQGQPETNQHHTTTPPDGTQHYPLADSRHPTSPDPIAGLKSFLNQIRPALPGLLPSLATVSLASLLALAPPPAVAEECSIDSGGGIYYRDRDGEIIYQREKCTSLIAVENSLPEGVFRGLTNLQSLSIIDDNLSSLPEGIFRGLTNLQELNLFTNLNSLPEGIFRGLTNLQWLYLNDNNLNSLPEGIFRGLTNLQELNLFTNLNSLPEGIFRGLTNLQWLYLNDNNLNSLPEGIFRGLTNLELNLAGNNLNSLPEGIFRGLTNLQGVSLQENPLTCVSLPLNVGLDIHTHSRSLPRCEDGIIISKKTIRIDDPLNQVDFPAALRSVAEVATGRIFQRFAKRKPPKPEDLVERIEYVIDKASFTSAVIELLAREDLRTFLQNKLNEVTGHQDYTVHLSGKPEGNVTVRISSDHPDAFVITPNTLTFTPENYNIPQNVKVRPSFAIDNYIDGNIPTLSTLSHTSTSSSYASKEVQIGVTGSQPIRDRLHNALVEIYPDVQGIVIRALCALNPACAVALLAEQVFDLGKFIGETIGSIPAVDQALDKVAEGLGTAVGAARVSYQQGGVPGLVNHISDQLTSSDGDPLPSISSQPRAAVQSRIHTRSAPSFTQGNTTASASALSSVNQVLERSAHYLFSHHQDLNAGHFQLQHALAVLGTDFNIPLSSLDIAQQDSATGQAPSAARNFALWGSVDYSQFGDAANDFSINGHNWTFTLGVDGQIQPSLLAGLALSHSTARSNYDYFGSAMGGDYDVDLTVVSPYLNWSATDTLGLWASVGYGKGNSLFSLNTIGDLQLASLDELDQDDTRQREDSDFFSFAGGIRWDAFRSDHTQLAFKLAGSTSSFLDTESQQARLAAELSRDLHFHSGVLSSSMDLALLLDRDNPSVMEILAGLDWAAAHNKFTASTVARTLLFGGERYEWGLGAALNYQAGVRPGEGLSLSLKPSFGITNPDLVDLDILSSLDEAHLAFNPHHQPTARLNAQLRYGIPTAKALLTPYIDASLAHNTNTYTTGLRYELDNSLDLDLSASHRTRSSGNNDNRFFLQLRSDL